MDMFWGHMVILQCKFEYGTKFNGHSPTPAYCHFLNLFRQFLTILNSSNYQWTTEAGVIKSEIQFLKGPSIKCMNVFQISCYTQIGCWVSFSWFREVKFGQKTQKRVLTKCTPFLSEVPPVPFRSAARSFEKCRLSFEKCRHHPHH